jgi:hypothetical protein
VATSLNVTQVASEQWTLGLSSSLQATSVSLEHWVLTVPAAQVTFSGIEHWGYGALPDLQITQVAIEHWASTDTPAVVTQSGLEQWVSKTGVAQLTQLAMEVWLGEPPGIPVYLKAVVTARSRSKPFYDFYASHADARVTQAALEEWSSKAGVAQLTLLATEMWASPQSVSILDMKAFVRTGSTLAGAAVSPILYLDIKSRISAGSRLAPSSSIILPLSARIKASSGVSVSEVNRTLTMPTTRVTVRSQGVPFGDVIPAPQGWLWIRLE